MDSCYVERTNSYKCDTCAFSREGNIGCANPNIWEKPPRDSYYKSRTEDINIVEMESIEKHLAT